MVRLGLLEIAKPLHDLAPRADLDGPEFFTRLAQLLCKRRVLIQDLCSGDTTVKQLAGDGHVDRRGNAHRLPSAVRQQKCVLRRGRRSRDQVCLAVDVHRNEPIQAKEGGATHQWVGSVAQEPRVKAKTIVLPQVLAQPRPSKRPVCPHWGAIAIVSDRIGQAPDIRVVMRRPAPAAIVLAGHRSARHAQGCRQIEQGTVALGQVGCLGRPVIHLCIDVERPVAAPRSSELFVPDALQIGGLRAGPAGGDQQVAPIVEQERRQGRLGIAAERADPFVGRQGRRG